MLEMQLQVLSLWYRAGDWMLEFREDTSAQRDRGEVTATTALIVLLVIAAIAAGGIIAARILSNANSVPAP